MDILSERGLIGLVGVVLLIVLVLLELYFPEREYDGRLRGRAYLTNMLVFGFNNLVFVAFQITSMYFLAYSYRLHDSFELLPVWLQVFASIVLLDFFIWGWHVVNHKMNFLWRFHKCHHSEHYLNATSALRFHLGELLLSVVVKSIFLVLVGIPFWIFVVNEFLITFFAAFHHSNIRLPQRLQRIVEKIFITPDLHRTHHSALRDEHDSNYGVIFSWWDRLFLTKDTRQPKDIGLKGVSEKNIWSFLVFPFRRK